MYAYVCIHMIDIGEIHNKGRSKNLRVYFFVCAWQYFIPEAFIVCWINLINCVYC